MAKNESVKNEKVTIGKFRALAQRECNGCDLITSEENKLKTDDVVAAGVLTIDDFALCEVDGKEIGVVTFVEFPEKYYWGGQAITSMVTEFVAACGGEEEAREQYRVEDDKVKVTFEETQTKSKQTFIKVTVL